MVYIYIYIYIYPSCCFALGIESVTPMAFDIWCTTGSKAQQHTVGSVGPMRIESRTISTDQYRPVQTSLSHHISNYALSSSMAWIPWATVAFPVIVRGQQTTNGRVKGSVERSLVGHEHIHGEWTCSED